MSNFDDSSVEEWFMLMLKYASEIYVRGPWKDIYDRIVSQPNDKYNAIGEALSVCIERILRSFDGVFLSISRSDHINAFILDMHNMSLGCLVPTKGMAIACVSLMHDQNNENAGLERSGHIIGYIHTRSFLLSHQIDDGSIDVVDAMKTLIKMVYVLSTNNNPTASDTSMKAAIMCAFVGYVNPIHQLDMSISICSDESVRKAAILFLSYLFAAILRSQPGSQMGPDVFAKYLDSDHTWSEGTQLPDANMKSQYRTILSNCITYVNPKNYVQPSDETQCPVMMCIKVCEQRTGHAFTDVAGLLLKMLFFFASKEHWNGSFAFGNLTIRRTAFVCE